MEGIIHFESFLLAGILLNLTPGNDTLFILTKSIAQGRKAGMLSVMGIATGSIIHTLLAACGLSLIITTSILLFNIIKYTGAIYLIYLGYKMLVEKSKFNMTIKDSNTKINTLRIYRDGLLTNLLNPKVALFFIAFLPQFIAPEYPDKLISFLLLGICFTFTGTIWCLVLAYCSSSLFNILKTNMRIGVFIHNCCGIVLILLGLKVAFSDPK